jgi:hypothetical protein
MRKQRFAISFPKICGKLMTARSDFSDLYTQAKVLQGQQVDASIHTPSKYTVLAGMLLCETQLSFSFCDSRSGTWCSHPKVIDLGVDRKCLAFVHYWPSFCRKNNTRSQPTMIRSINSIDRIISQY